MSPTPPVTTGHRVVPLIDERTLAWAPPSSSPLHAQGLLSDTLGRPLRDLRISVTDRCNFRCSYCMPKEVFDKDYTYLPHASLLSFEEITRLTKIFVAHGVEKIRLTGGEPLLRKNVEALIAQLAQLRTVDGQPLDLTLTTNGSLLRRKAQALKDAGQARDLLEAQQGRVGQVGVVLAEDLLGHAVAAAEVAAVGHADTQIAQRAAQGVAEQALGGQRVAGKWWWCCPCQRTFVDQGHYAVTGGHGKSGGHPPILPQWVRLGRFDTTTAIVIPVTRSVRRLLRGRCPR